MKKNSHLFNLSKILLSYICKREVLGFMPTRLWIEVSSKCNLKCGSCLNRSLPICQKTNMGLGLYKKIIDQAAGNIYDATLCHRGEPLLHRDIVKMVSYASIRGVKTKIHTNATLLDERLSRELIMAGLYNISFSFDSFDKEKYEKKRKGAEYNNTLNNIKTFLKVKKKLKRRKPFTILQLMEKRGNNDFPQPRDIKKFLKTFKDYPPDRIILRRPHNWGGLLKGPKDLADSRIKRSTCTFPWYSLTVLANGKAVPCPQDFMGIMPIGDLNKDSLKDTFNGQPLRAIRKMFASSRIKKKLPCQDCDRIIRKTIMGIPLEYAVAFFRENS